MAKRKNPPGLQQRHRTWYYVRKVPRDLRARFSSKGSKPLLKVVVSLETQNVREAQAKRDELDGHWTRQFERTRAGAPLSGADIAEAKREVYLSALDHMEAQARAGLAPKAEPQEPPDGSELEPRADEIAALSIAHELYGEALEEGDYSMALADLAAIERRLRVKIEPDTDTYRQLADAILVANMEAFAARMKIVRGLPVEIPAPLPAIVRPVIRDAVAFSVAADAFLAEMQRDPATRLTDSSRRQYAKAFRLFGEYIHNGPLVAVDRKAASSFLDTIARLDPTWGQHQKSRDLPLSELLKKFGQGEGQLSNAALNHYVSALKSLFDWARKRGDFERDNPFAEQSRKAGDDKWQPYTMAELATLLDAIPAGSTMRWVTLVGLFSGMRLEEICQLRTSDVKNEAGVWFFDILKAKTEAGIRRVPVHSKLIAAGILDLAEGQGQLWPELKPSGRDNKLSVDFSKRFGRMRRNAEIERKGLAFHSLRKNFTTALDQAGVAQADAAVLLGHARGFSFDRYSGGPGLQRLRDVVERVSYPALINHLHIE
jgi:integrase